MVQLTFTTSVIPCCVMATILIRYAELCKGWKRNQKLTTLSPLTMVRRLIIEISTRYAVDVNHGISLSGLPP